MTHMNPIKPVSIEAFAYRVPIGTPIKVSFGTFRDRPMVLVRVVDSDAAATPSLIQQRRVLCREQ